MANKNLLKTILNVNCVKIKNWKIDLSKSTIYIHVDMTKARKEDVLSVVRSVKDMIPPLNLDNGVL